MSNKATGRTRVVASNKTLDLAAEAADMETRLNDLRKAMELERAKREHTGDGPIWRNGATGLLRSKFRTQSGSASGSTGSAGSSRASSSQSTQKPGQPKGSYAPNPQQPITAPSRLYSNPTNTHPASGLNAPVALPVSGTTVPTASPQTWGGRPSPVSGRQPPITRAGSNQEAPGGGMSCGTDDNDNLMEGAFNEADSHKSFLDALNEWRNANRSTNNQSSSKAETPELSTNTGTAMEVQTEGTSTPRPRPASAKQQLSYFDKLLLNSQSRQAGQAASGGSAPSMSPRHTLSSQGSSSIPGLPAIELSSSQRTSAATGMPARPSQVYSVDTALNTPLPPLPSPSQSSKRNSIQGGGTPSGQRLKGLDILEELEALELQRHNAALAYDSDEEFKAFGRHTQAQAQPDIVVTNATGLVGLTKGVRLPDAILVPSEDADKTDD